MNYINNLLSDEATIQADNGFFFGQGAFETILMLDQPVFLEEHIARLNSTLFKLGINKRIETKDMRLAIETMKVKDCGIKIAVSEKNVAITHRPLTYQPIDYEKGARLTIGQLTRDTKALTTGMKTFNYLDLITENKRAKNQGYMDAVLLNEQGYVGETCFSNLFWVKDNRLYTPSLNCGVLPGIVRSWVIRNYQVREDQFPLRALTDCDGAFITNSLMGIMPVCHLIGHDLVGLNWIRSIGSAYQEELKGYRYGEGQ